MTGKLKEAAKVEAVRSSSKRTPDVIGNQPVQTDGAHVRRPLAQPIRISACSVKIMIK